MGSRFYFILLFLVIGFVSYGQSDQVIIENANNQVIETRSDPTVQYLNGDVRAYHQGSYIYCDTAVLKGNELYAIGNVSILQDDSVRIFADTLVYLGDSSLALFKKEVILENGGDRLYTSDLEYHLDTKMAYYFNKAVMVNGADTIKSKRGRYNANIKEAFFYENVSVDGTNFMLRSDSLRFLTEARHAFWSSPCIIHSDSAQIYSEKGQYNLSTKYGEFEINAQYIKKDTFSYADQIIYNGEIEKIELNGNAHYSTPTDYAVADTISSDLKNDITELKGNAIFLSDSLVAEGQALKFDQKNDLLTMQGRSKYSDGPLSIEAEDLKFNRQTDDGIAVGNVVWVDTSAHSTIYCDSLEYRGADSYFKAIGFDSRPIFANEVDGDTLWLSADTLFSYGQVVYFDSLILDTLYAAMVEDPVQVTDFFLDSLNHKDTIVETDLVTLESDTIISIDSLDRADSTTIVLPPRRLTILGIDTIFYEKIPIDTVQYLVGDNDVKVFKEDMQLVSDSLIYNDLDSTFTFIDGPIMWTDTTQLTGDTIILYLKNGQIHSLKMIDNAMVINSPDLYFFNQIGGRVINGYFKEKQLDKMKVDGNAQSIYYMQEEDGGYIGANSTECSLILFGFKEKKISDIRFYVEPNSKIYPIEGTDHEAIKLSKFKWLFHLKPQGVESISSWSAKGVVEERMDTIGVDSTLQDVLIDDFERSENMERSMESMQSEAPDKVKIVKPKISGIKE